ncbi:MAG: hypothetical protein H7X78_02050 [Methyloceanibacter sp.]|jgi:hypothetical protein|nr:hypothetical protein [Methyloceanibacter sp.]
MTERRQALRPGKQAATSLFLALVLILFLTPPSVLAKNAEGAATQAALAGQAALFALLLLLLSTVTLVSWHYRRRDYTSPRRYGRRI